MNDYLANLAFQGGPQEMLDAARFYETVPGQEDKAVLLYHKAGHTGKAVDLAFKANKYSELGLITDGLTEKTDPQLVRRVADFFMENEQFDKAVDLLAVTKKVDQALDLLVKYNVPITESLAEKLTPQKRNIFIHMISKLVQFFISFTFNTVNSPFLSLILKI